MPEGKPEKTKMNGAHWRQRNSIYLALEEVDLSWGLHEVLDIEDMWAAGIPVADIARKVRRPNDECILLIFDRAMKGKIKGRPGGIYGSLPKLQEEPKKGARIAPILEDEQIHQEH